MIEEYQDWGTNTKNNCFKNYSDITFEFNEEKELLESDFIKKILSSYSDGKLSVMRPLSKEYAYHLSLEGKDYYYHLGALKADLPSLPDFKIPSEVLKKREIESRENLDKHKRRMDNLFPESERKNYFIEYLPNFVDGPRDRFGFDTLEEFLKHDLCKFHKNKKDFYRFSIKDPNLSDDYTYDPRFTLMREYHEGYRLVCGFLKHDIPSLPRW